MNKAPAIGIDLGTSFSCVGVWQNGKVNIIPNELGKRTTPSYVAFTDTERLIGKEAKNQIGRNANNTVFDSLRLIGRKFGDKEVQEDIKYWPFKVIKDNKSDRPLVQITYKNIEKNLYAEEICAMILQKLKQAATDFLGKKVKDAIITVPTFFNDSQRQAIKDAGTISGLNVLRIVDAPTAASFTYGLAKKKEENVLIFDLGGGTLNISLLSIEDGLFEVKATDGNLHLGGEDFDNRLMEYCINEFKRKSSIDIKKNVKALAKVKIACEKAKKILSYSTQTTVYIEALMNGKDLNIVITRFKFEYLCFDLFKKCISPLENVLKNAKMDKSQIDEIILIGGSTHIPKIQSMLKEFFNGKELLKDINPNEAVAFGAAIHAAIMTNVKDEKIEKLVPLDVTPFSLGIETSGGVMEVLIPRNDCVPTKKTKVFSTYFDNQTYFLIQIYEGEGQLTKDNHLLGKFFLDGIPPMPKGQPQIEITFDVDANLIINVSAREIFTGKNNRIVITNEKGRLSKDDIDKLCKEFGKFEEENNEIKERIEAKINLEEYWLKVKINLKDDKIKDKFSEEDKKNIENKIDEIQKWENDNPSASKEEYEAKIKEIEGVFNPIMQKIYQQAGIDSLGIPIYGGDYRPKGTASGDAEDVE